MAEAKTKPTEQSVDSFLANVAEEQVRTDCYAIIKLMEKASGEPPKMWGPAIIGFGSYHFKYDSGREGDICTIGFSPRKGKITLYVLCGFQGQEQVLEKLGKHKAEGGCLYIKKLTDVNVGVLENLIKQSFEFKKKLH
jgi:Domain of unknown function (DU1801)